MSINLDDKDKKILMILQENSREQLKIIAKQVNLSIDSTKKRIEKLKKAGIIARFGIFIDPKALGHEIVANCQIKLRNISEEELNKFLAHLRQHDNVIDLLSTLGEYDLTCVIIARNTEEVEIISRKIRQKFKDLIDDWKSVINLKVYKFEYYNLH